MENYFITTDTALLQLQANKIQYLLKDCFWSKHVPLNIVKKFLNHSLCFGVINKIDNKLVGFGRAITDYTTFAYIADVIIDETHRRKKLATRLVKTILAHPELQHLKTWALKPTEEAKEIYLRHGFAESQSPCKQLEINRYDIYANESSTTIEPGLVQI